MKKNREFVSASGTANDVVQRLAQAIYARGGDDDDLRRIISDESLRGKIADLVMNKPTAPARNWREQDGVIRFSVTSDGTTGEEWIERHEQKGVRISDCAKSVLRSADFKPTSDVTTEIAVLKGDLFADSDRITKKIRAEAVKRQFGKPNAEAACLIREKFTDEEIEAMGLWAVVVMHEPIEDSDGDLRLLNANRYDDGRWLNAFCGEPDVRWNHDADFAFVAAQGQ